MSLDWGIVKKEKVGNNISWESLYTDELSWGQVKDSGQSTREGKGEFSLGAKNLKKGNSPCCKWKRNGHPSNWATEYDCLTLINRT